MKKCLLVLALLFSVFTSFSQFTNTRSQSNPNTLEIWGEKNSDYKLSGLKGYHISAWFPDTLSANNYLLIRNIPNIFIAVGNEEVYKRSYDAKRWILIGGNNCRGTQLISGSITWSGSGLVYDATDLDYYILCTRYFANSTTLTLSTADPTYPRIDKFYADITGAIGVITGTPSVNPQEPATNPLSQIDMGFVYIPAGSTVPAGTVQTVIYNENVEWSGTSDVPSIDFDYATNPYIGSVSTYVPSAPNSSYIEWQSGGTDYLFSNAQYLKFWVRLNDNFVSEPLSFLDVTFEYTDVTVSSTLAVGNGSYNMDYSIIDEWQLVSIPLSGITTYGTEFNEVHFVINSAPASFQIDYVYLLETATVPPVIGNAWLTSGNSAINDATQYIGTSDPKKLNFGTNSQIRAYIDTGGIELLDDTTANVMLIDSNGKIWKTYQPTILADSPLVIYQDVYQKHIKADTTRRGAALATQYYADSVGMTKWSTTGNAGTTAGTNFIGNTDNVGLMFKVNNVQAGYINTIRLNTSLGYQTLLNNTTGTENVALGYVSMRSNTTGAANVGIGSGALLDNTTGLDNVAVGATAGVSNTTGRRNTFIGSQGAGAGGTTDSSIALGFAASAASKQFAISPVVNEIKATGITGASNSGYVLTTNGSGIATFQAAGGGSVLTGNLLYVDAVNGNDGTGALGDFTKPYLTLAAAKTAATKGYTIVVRPGTYTVSTSIAKDSVDWYFYPNTSVTMASDVDSTGIWDDGGTEMHFTVTGSGKFSRSTADEFLGVNLINITNAASVMNIEADELITVCVDGESTVINQLNGEINIAARLIGITGSNVYAVWWFNGKMNINVSTINSEYVAVEGRVDATPTGDANITVQDINGQISNRGINGDAALWIRANTVSRRVSSVGVNKLYVECQKIFGDVYTNSDAGLVYIRTDKITDFTGNGCLNIGGGEVWVDVSHLDPGVNTGAIIVSGGELKLRGADFTATATAVGVSVSGGTLRISDCNINTAANSSTSPITKSGGTLIVKDCTLVAESTATSISAPTAQTVISYNSFGNKAIDTDVTINGILTIGSYVQ